MRTIRWLPAVALAAAACLSTPQAQAQTWLRWKKEAPVHDPATLTPRSVVVPVVPVVAESVAPVVPVALHGPSITISEEQPVAVSDVEAAPDLAARASGLKPLPQERSSVVPVVSRIEPSAAVAGGASAPAGAAVTNIPTVVPIVRQTATSIAPLVMSTASVQAVASGAAAPSLAAPTPIASPPVDPSLLPATVAATALPASIEASAVLAAPLEASTMCADCATADELRATSARPGKGDAPPEGLEIQAEAKRRLLQGR